jgi:hypothetical protein
VDRQRGRDLDAAPDRVYVLLIALFGLLALGLGTAWLLSPPPARPAAPADLPRPLRDAVEDAPAGRSVGPGTFACAAAACTVALLVSWRITRARLRILRPHREERPPEVPTARR